MPQPNNQQLDELAGADDNGDDQFQSEFDEGMPDEERQAMLEAMLEAAMEDPEFRQGVEEYQRDSQGRFA